MAFRAFRRQTREARSTRVASPCRRVRCPSFDRAHSALTAAGIKLTVTRSGPPLGPQAEALLGWVVREAVTNAVRHSAARQCEITLSGGAERVRLSVVDDGVGAVAAVSGGAGSGHQDRGSASARD